MRFRGAQSVRLIAVVLAVAKSLRSVLRNEPRIADGVRINAEQCVAIGWMVIEPKVPLVHVDDLAHRRHIIELFYDAIRSLRARRKAKRCREGRSGDEGQYGFRL